MQTRIRDWTPEQLATFNRLAETSGRIFTIFIEPLNWLSYWRLKDKYPNLQFWIWRGESVKPIHSLNNLC